MPTFLRSAWLAPLPTEPVGSLFLWGEVQAQNWFEATPSLGGDSAPGQDQESYSITPPAMLRFQVRQILPRATLRDMSLQKFAVQVPAEKDGRAAMPELPLRKLRVFGVKLPAHLAFELLGNLNSPEEVTPEESQAPDRTEGVSASRNFQLSTDTLFWCKAWEFAGALVESGCVLPALLSQEKHLLLNWKAWRGDPKVEASIQHLSALMPAVNLEYGPNLESRIDGRQLMRGFLDAAINVMMRRRMAGQTSKVSRSNGTASLNWSAAGELWHSLLAGQPVEVSKVSGGLQSVFRRQWQLWISRAAYFDQTRVQVVFELKSPTPMESQQEKATWTLEFGVQQVDHGQTYLTARDIWTGSSENCLLEMESETMANPGMHLLAGLRIASSLWSPLRRISDKSLPHELHLTLTEAYEYLESGADLLHTAGFKTLMPEWWNPQTQSDLRLVMQLRDSRGNLAKSDSQLEPEDQEAFAVEWRLALGQELLSHSQIQNLAQAQSPLVYMNDQWLRFNEKQIEAARISLAHETQDHKVSLFQALRLLQEHSETQTRPNSWTWSEIGGKDGLNLPALPVSMESPTGRMQRIWHALQAVNRDDSLEEPPGFVGKLRPYQKRGLAWLWYLHQVGLGACLADDMGLGKTIQAIALFLAQEQIRDAHGRLPRLLICPTSVLRNWQREIERFAPQLQTYLHHGPRRADSQRFFSEMRQYDVILTSFGTARVDQDTLRSITWHTLVIDEAQNIKNASTQQAQAIRSFFGQNKIALTGTPIENRLSELWSVLDFVNRGYLGTQANFFRRYIRPIEGQDDRQRLEHLKRIVQPFVLRRLKSDPDVISELPEKQEITVTCDLSPEQTLLYAGAVSGARSGLKSLEGIRRRGTILALITKLKKITNHPALLQEDDAELSRRSGKLDRLMEMLEESLDNQNKAIIFTTFVRMGMFLQQSLQEKLDVQADFLHGAVDLSRRQEMVDRFQNGGQQVPILLLSLRTGGVGINLTAANQVYHFDRWWNPAVEQQATDRAHRIGQSKRVQVYKFMVAGTIEEHIDNLIRDKTSLAEEVLGSGEAWLTELSNERLFELLSLPQAGTELSR